MGVTINSKLRISAGDMQTQKRCLIFHGSAVIHRCSLQFCFVLIPGNAAENDKLENSSTGQSYDDYFSPAEIKTKPMKCKQPNR